MPRKQIAKLVSEEKLPNGNKAEKTLAENL